MPNSIEVDAHNIVPCWIASAKQAYNAHTFRPKINRLLSEFLVEYPVLRKHPVAWEKTVSKIAWEKSLKTLDIDLNISEVDWIKPGEKAAKKTLDDFIEWPMDSDHLFCITPSFYRKM